MLMPIGYRKYTGVAVCARSAAVRGRPSGVRAGPSERQTGAELECAARKCRTGDLTHSRTSDAGVRNAQARVIESVARIKPELKLTALQFRNAQGLAGRKIDVGKVRSAQDVPALVAEFVLA